MADSLWTLKLFEERLDSWIELDKPGQDLRIIVAHWVLGRADNPYIDVNREPGFDNLWFGPVLESEHGNGMVVACSYWIKEFEHVVSCNSFATLSLPL